MKNLIATFFIALFSLTIATANNNPKENSGVTTFKVEESHAASVSAIINTTDNTVSLTSLLEVNFIQVLNEAGKLEFQLPMFSKDVTIDLDDFAKGNYQVNLLLANDEIISSTFVK